MKSLLSALRTSRSRRAFTLVELAVSAALVSGLGLIAFSVMRSGMLLSSQNTSVNLSAQRGRQMIDWVGEQTRYSLGEPTLITTSGSTAAGTTADGILVKRYVGSPYLVKDASGGDSEMAATTTKICLEYRPSTASDPGVPTPEVGDYILMESLERPEREIVKVENMAGANNMIRRLVTLNAQVGEILRPSAYRITGQLYRKEAFVFASEGNERFQLRHYRRVKGGTNYASASEYDILANSYRRLNNEAFFTDTTSNNAGTTTLRALVNASSKSEVIERGSTNSAFTTIPIQLRLWSLNR